MSSRPNSRNQGRLSFLGVCGVFLWIASQIPCYAQELDVPYVPTPEPVVARMLDIAHVSKGDYLIDLGSGDGRIVIAAAKLGAVGHGVDLDPHRIREARLNARAAGVDNRVEFLQQNIFDTDISQASVVTMYLLPSVNIKLRPMLLKTLRPGTRVVSHSFDMDEWEPDTTYTISNGVARNHSIYLWIIPARADGNWKWRLGDDSYTMNVRQNFQKIKLMPSDNGHPLEAKNEILRGDRIGFTMNNGSNHYIYSGFIEGNSISGMVQIHNGEDYHIEHWSASRR